MAKNYEYIVDNYGGQTLVGQVRGTTRLEGYKKEGDEYLREIELEDAIMIESRIEIDTEIDVYVTGFFTNGGDHKHVELRVRVPVKYIAGEEEAIADLIEEEAIRAIGEFDENFVGDGFQIESIEPDMQTLGTSSDKGYEIDFKPKPPPTRAPPRGAPPRKAPRQNIASKVIGGAVKFFKGLFGRK